MDASARSALGAAQRWRFSLGEGRRAFRSRSRIEPATHQHGAAGTRLPAQRHFLQPSRSRSHGRNSRAITAAVNRHRKSPRPYPPATPASSARNLISTWFHVHPLRCKHSALGRSDPAKVRRPFLDRFSLTDIPWRWLGPTGVCCAVAARFSQRLVRLHRRCGFARVIRNGQFGNQPVKPGHGFAIAHLRSELCANIAGPPRRVPTLQGCLPFHVQCSCPTPPLPGQLRRI